MNFIFIFYIIFYFNKVTKVCCKKTKRKEDLEHALVEVGVGQPLDGLLGILHTAKHHLGVQVVRQLGNQLRLNGQLLVHQGQVVLQLAVVGQQHSFAL